MSRSCESCLNTAISWIGSILRACVRGRSRKGPACTGGVSLYHISSQYDAIRLTVLNRHGGVVDRTRAAPFRMSGVKAGAEQPELPHAASFPTCGMTTESGVYAYHPTAADYAALRDAVGQYLSAFRERTPELERSGPKLVYICAPLRGDVTNNVEFARQKAQEVFADGDIPVCPHLLFPPIADPNHPEQDAKRGRCPCNCWNPASSSMFMVLSGRKECGMRSTMPASWGFR